MNWWRRQFGLHPVDMAIHATVGGLLCAGIDEAFHTDSLTLLALAGVIALYAWRRQRVIAQLPAAGGMTSGEVRLAELDAQAEELHELRHRVGELEERLDFTERMLARQHEPEQLGRG